MGRKRESVGLISRLFGGGKSWWKKGGKRNHWGAKSSKKEGQFE